MADWNCSEYENVQQIWLLNNGANFRITIHTLNNSAFNTIFIVTKRIGWLKKVKKYAEFLFKFERPGGKWCVAWWHLLWKLMTLKTSFIASEKENGVWQLQTQKKIDLYQRQKEKLLLIVISIHCNNESIAKRSKHIENCH